MVKKSKSRKYTQQTAINNIKKTGMNRDLQTLILQGKKRGIQINDILEKKTVKLQKGGNSEIEQYRDEVKNFIIADDKKTETETIKLQKIFDIYKKVRDVAAKNKDDHTTIIYSIIDYIDSTEFENNIVYSNKNNDEKEKIDERRAFALRELRRLNTDPYFDHIIHNSISSYFPTKESKNTENHVDNTIEKTTTFEHYFYPKKPLIEFGDKKNENDDTEQNNDHENKVGQSTYSRQENYSKGSKFLLDVTGVEQLLNAIIGSSNNEPEEKPKSHKISYKEKRDIKEMNVQYPKKQTTGS